MVLSLEVCGPFQPCGVVDYLVAYLKLTLTCVIYMLSYIINPVSFILCYFRKSFSSVFRRIFSFFDALNLLTLYVIAKNVRR